MSHADPTPYLQALRTLRLTRDVNDCDERAIIQLSELLHSKKHKSLHPLLLDVLNSSLQSSVFTGERVVDMLKTMYKGLLSKLAKSDELEPQCIQIMACILAHSTPLFFDAEFDHFFQKRIERGTFRDSASFCFCLFFFL